MKETQYILTVKLETVTREVLTTRRGFDSTQPFKTERNVEETAFVVIKTASLNTALDAVRDTLDTVARTVPREES